MHPAGALPRHRRILLFDNVQFGGRPALAHRQDLDRRAGIRRGIVAHLPHV
jgi:hypothetical protein